MFYNKYAHITSLTLLKAQKPHQGIVPQGPDLANFTTNNVNLNTAANFCMEMMKWLPDFEQLIYDGQMKADEGEEGAVLIEHGYVRDSNGDLIFGSDGNPVKQKMWVTEEWWDKFNEFSISPSEVGTYFVDKDDGADEHGQEYIDLFKAYLVQNDTDGKITNYDTILAHEYAVNHDKKWDENHTQLVDRTDNDYQDGFEHRETWIHGQHHRSASFGPFGSGDIGSLAGSGMGANFKNLDFDVDAGEWNHIFYKDSSSFNPDTIEDKAYFVGDMLKSLGKNWNDVKNLLNTKFAGQSFYQIVMNESYKTCNNGSGLTAEESTLLSLGMLESRSRAWQGMTMAFGDVTDTRNASAMMQNIDEFILGNNPYQNHHALSLFPLFLYMQHSFINQATMYYQKFMKSGANELGDGWNLSVLNRDKFLKFIEWTGRETYDNADKNGNGIARGKLYEYFDQISSNSKLTSKQKKARKDAVLELADEWFGATDPRSGKPTWEFYKDDSGWASWQWVNINDSSLPWIHVWAGDWKYGRPIAARILPDDYGAYGWDRVAPGGLIIRVRDAANQEYDGWAYRGYSSWGEIYNYVYAGVNHVNPNTFRPDEAHPEYAGAQFYGLSTAQIMGSSPEFNSNWAVHAIGMYLKYGEGMDIQQVMARCARKRVIKAEYKQDVADYQERKDELEWEKAMDEKLEAKRIAKAIAQRKKLEKESEQKSNQASKAQKEKIADERNTPEYKKAMQQLRNRLLKASNKHKNWLKKAQATRS